MIEKQILKEFKKIAFVLKHTEIFNNFPSKIKNFLLDEEYVPVEWKKITTDIPEKNWTEATCEGLLKDNSKVKLIIIRKPNRNFYKLIHKDRQYNIHSLDELSDLTHHMQDSKDNFTKPELMGKIYKLFKKDSSFFERFKDYYLKDIAEKDWSVKIVKSAPYIFIRCFIPKTEEIDISERLHEHGNQRIDSILSYLKTILQSEDISTDKINIKYNIINNDKHDGFIISLR